jgi:hypothetical protein
MEGEKKSARGEEEGANHEIVVNLIKRMNEQQTFCRRKDCF